MKNKTDEELVKEYKLGNQDAFNEIYKRYKKVVLSYAHSVYYVGADLEDVVQEGMLGLLNAVNYYNGKSSFKNYVFLCVKTSIIKAVTRYFNNQNIPLNIAVGLEDCEAEINRITKNPEDEIIFKEAMDDFLKKADQVLNAFERQVLKLFLEGYSYVEISKELNCLPKKCDNTLQKIKKKLSN